MTRKKLSEWLNEQGYITTPEQILTVKRSLQQTENGANTLFVTYKMKGSNLDYCMGCSLNLHEITKELKQGYEMQVKPDKWGALELRLIKQLYPSLSTVIKKL